MSVTHARPRVVVSRCLGFEACRYNAQVIRDRFVEELGAHADLVTVCPEMDIGLGTPRDPIRLVAKREQPARLVQPATGRDVTDAMDAFAARFLGGVGDVDGFVLKNRSPSCGIGDVKVYPAEKDAAPTGKTAGRFGAAVLERFPLAAVEDEGRLRDYLIRDRFLTALWTLARFREARDKGTINALIDFHSRHKYVLLTANPRAMRELGRVVAAHPALRPETAFERYGERLGAALRDPASPRAHCDALQHGFGHVSEHLGPDEKRHFLERVEDFRQGRVPLSAPREMLWSWILRFREPYLSKQWYFEPYPRELLVLRDSGGKAIAVA